MSIQAVLLPVFVQVGLTFLLLFWMGAARVSSLRRGETKLRDVALRQPAWPERATKIANAFHNQLELPLLFYVLVLLAILTRKADMLFTVMAWMFVAARIVHAAIHVTGNDVRRRFLAFLFGAMVLLMMWIVFAGRILVADVSAAP
jgi:hypothetical protein